MPAVLNNNAVSRLASSLSSGATTLSVTTGEGAKFPSPSAGQWFPLTIIKSSGALEILRCTARSGDVFTVTRAQEGTAAQAFSVGDRVEIRVTAAVFAELASNTATAQTAANTGIANAATADAKAVTADGKAVTAQNKADSAYALANDPWAVQPIGVLIPVLDNLAGASVPLTNSALYRYIKLTAADAHNAGVLISESVSGSAPLVQATAVINLAGSPLNGQTVRLINTERRGLRAGSAGTVEADQFQGFGLAGQFINSGVAYSGATYSNLATIAPGMVSGTTVLLSGNITSDGTNGTPRTGLETRNKNIGATYYMRIK